MAVFAMMTECMERLDQETGHGEGRVKVVLSSTAMSAATGDR